jgi:hypothetical protein
MIITYFEVMFVSKDVEAPLRCFKAFLDQQQSSAGPGSATAKPLEWYM